MVGQIGAAHKASPPPTSAGSMTSEAGRAAGRLDRARRWIERHPLLVVAGVASMVAVGHAWWIWSHRDLGALDPDEAGYIASALRMERTLTSLILPDFIQTVGGTGNGITVPLLSVPLAVLGPRDPRTVMMAQPLLLVFTSAAVAGITRRIAGPIAAICAGVLFAVLPSVSTATQSYWFGLGATASLAGAVWALLASDRCTNRRIWLFGVGIGLMWLSRTMTLGYGPALVAAGVVVAGWDSRRLLRLAGSVGLGVAISAPWYMVNRDSIFGYLFSYGYGPRAARFGNGGPLERAGFRISRFEDAFGRPTFTLLWASALCVGVMVAWAVCRGRRKRPPLRGPTAVAVAVALGSAALVSTSNNGVWFELPIVPLIVALFVAVISLGPGWYSTLLATAVAAFSMSGLAHQWWLLPYGPERPTAHYEYGFAQYDERFDPTRRELHPVAAAQWRELTEDVLEVLRPIAPHDSAAMLVTISGNMQLFNTNTLTLAGELSGWQPVLRVPDTLEPARARALELSPTAVVRGQTVPRVLLIADHDRILFTPDSRVELFARQARSEGWRTTDVVPMPGGGEVIVMRHPASS
jgi:4-amino-4-deoxy-L-arabinose transferase-like glycosyltransferase